MAMQIVIPGPLTNNDSVARVPLGTRAEDINGNEYIYLQGVAATVPGDAVTFNNSTYATVRLTNAAVAGARVAFAMGAVVAAQFGWYLINGTGTGVAAAAVAANAPLQATATAGAVDDTAVAGDSIIGAWSRAAAGGAGAVEIAVSYPSITGLP